MTARQAMASVLQFFAVALLFSTGLLFISLPWSPTLVLALMNALEARVDVFLTLGVCVLGFSLALAMGCFSVSRKRTLLLRMGASVNVRLVRQTLASVLQKHFDSRMQLKDVQITRGNHLTLGLQLSAMDEEERKQILLQAERHLQHCLVEQFGYTRAFTVQASL